MPVFAMVKNVVTRAGCIAFFGPDFGKSEAFCHLFCFGLTVYQAKNRTFLEAAAEVADEVFIGAEFFRLLPESIAG